jgi:hypothetical protein
MPISPAAEAEWGAEAGTFVQRMSERPPQQPTEEAQAQTAPTEGPAADEGGEVDLDQMARQVYQILRRRLRVEEERRKGWKHA